jgi:hypothetical protein
MFLGKKNSDASKPTNNLKLNGATRDLYATVSKNHGILKTVCLFGDILTLGTTAWVSMFHVRLRGWSSTYMAAMDPEVPSDHGIMMP